MRNITTISNNQPSSLDDLPEKKNDDNTVSPRRGNSVNNDTSGGGMMMMMMIDNNKISNNGGRKKSPINKDNNLNTTTTITTCNYCYNFPSRYIIIGVIILSSSIAISFMIYFHTVVVIGEQQQQQQKHHQSYYNSDFEYHMVGKLSFVAKSDLKEEEEVDKDKVQKPLLLPLSKKKMKTTNIKQQRQQYDGGGNDDDEHLKQISSFGSTRKVVDHSSSSSNSKKKNPQEQQQQNMTTTSSLLHLQHLILPHNRKNNGSNRSTTTTIPQRVVKTSTTTTTKAITSRHHLRNSSSSSSIQSLTFKKTRQQPPHGFEATKDKYATTTTTATKNKKTTDSTIGVTRTNPNRHHHHNTPISIIKMTTSKNNATQYHNVTMSNTTSNSNSRCFPFNSQKWISAKQNRYGNINNDIISLNDDDDTFIYNTIINPTTTTTITRGLQHLVVVDDDTTTTTSSRGLIGGGFFSSSLMTILQQTLCLPSSRLLSLDDADIDSIIKDIDNNNNTSNRNQTQVLLHYWSLRLIYMAVHLHQHLPAKVEAEDRLLRRRDNNNCDLEMQSMNVGRFDYECPNTKFLIVPLGDKGLGAVMRLGAVNAFIAGIASNRTVVFVNNFNSTGGRSITTAKNGNNNNNNNIKDIQRPWLHASCPRRDIQCFFMPVTPCVLTNDDIRSAPLLTKGERRSLFKNGDIPQIYQGQKAVIVNINLRPQKTPTTFRRNVVNIIQTHILDPLKAAAVSTNTNNPSDHHHRRSISLLLQRATDYILEEEQPRYDNKYYYFGHNAKHNHALVLYAMRPNQYYAQKLKHILNATLSSSSSSFSFDPRLAFGLPIRASDKCTSGESECMSFDKYMNLMDYAWKKHKTKLLSEQQQQQKQQQQSHDGNSNIATAKKTGQHQQLPSIIVTSESSSVHKAHEDFVYRHKQEADDQKNHSFPFNFIKNEFDLHQGSGDPADFISSPSSAQQQQQHYNSNNNNTNLKTNNNITRVVASADDIMLSSISSLQIQLYGRYTYGNCCSNFHLLLFDFLKGGCGINHDHVATCLQDSDLPEFRLCCEWSKDEECLAKKNKNGTTNS